LHAATPDARWLVVSGGDQAELRGVFEIKGSDPFFSLNQQDKRFWLIDNSPILQPHFVALH